MNFIQSTLQAVEVGKGQILVRIIPLLAALLVVGGAYDVMVFHGLNDSQSMDNAQLARQIVRGRGYTTEFLRPQALTQLRDYATSKNLQAGKTANLFPPDRFPAGVPRILPDTYNAPGYPCLLATFFFFTHPEFDQVPSAMSSTRVYAGERLIPVLNQILMILTALLVFALGRRLFDDRVAWISLIAFLGTDLIWHFTLTALSTSFLMFLVTAMLMCVLEIICVGEACFENEDRSFGPAWGWGLAAAVLLGAACLTRLDLVILLVPLFFFLMVMPRASFILGAVISLVVIGMVVPWFVRMNNISGDPLGSNLPLLLYGQGEYAGNQIFCMSSIPSYEHIFKYATTKETSGFLYQFQHGWNLLGSNPLVFLFGASILHQFKRRRTRLFHWMIFCCAIVLIAANNLGSAAPDIVSGWNVLVLLFPCMLVMGTAFFFILLDRLNVQIMLLNSMIVTAAVVFILMPLTLTLLNPGAPYYAFPPYWPPLIKAFSQFAQPEEWVTTDMPWATAWYGDRASLWMPDSIADFENLNKNVCPTGLLLLTPVSWAEPVSTFTSGEYKDWAGFISFSGDFLPPADFPLTVHSMTPAGGPDYAVWSDRPRWQER
jgi:4-amino-4-deoxy-L-arabinose transferase-like glycosyltransferase